MLFVVLLLVLFGSWSEASSSAFLTRMVEQQKAVQQALATAQLSGVEQDLRRAEERYFFFLFFCFGCVSFAAAASVCNLMHIMQEH
jgi:hypothetical protein